MKISVKHLFTLVLRAETEKPAERGQGSIMPSNKFICWEVVKRGRAGGQGVLCLSARQEIEISLHRNREVSGWPAQQTGGGGGTAVKALPTPVEFINWNWSNREGGGGGARGYREEWDEEETQGRPLPVITAPLFKCQHPSARGSSKG